MYQMLNKNQIVYTETTGKSCRVDEYLGGGGQGEVYRATLNGNSIALKWYLPHAATEEQKNSLRLLIKKGPPNEKFLWPIDLAFAENTQNFGYIMLLRDPSYKSLMDLMRRRAEPTFWALATAGFGLADSFFQLHSKGFCYRDISFGNVFFNPTNGDVLICDNDNVSIHGEKRTAVSGTPRFMAPEIVRGEAKPSIDTDLFSLSVLLFYMLMMHHPLEGKRELEIHCLDLPAMRKLYGSEPVFVFDPKNESNRPQKGYHDNVIDFWPIYPMFITKLFLKSFTTGLNDPRHGRVRESEWRAAMIRLRDSIIYCGNCSMENFYDNESSKVKSGEPERCWKCKSILMLPPRIKIDGDIIMLNSDSKLYSHHIDKQRLYDFSDHIAEVAQHPQNPDVWGLRNMSKDKWVATNIKNEIIDIFPKRSVTLYNGLEINFGKAIGKVEWGNA